MSGYKVILVDADVLSHFIAANKIYDLPKILSPHKLMIVEQVYIEASYNPIFDNRQVELDLWMTKCKIPLVRFPYTNKNIKFEFYRLKKKNPLLGKGELACMSMARFGRESIASSNFRDVAAYCEANGIEYIGVMDILLIAIRKGIYTEADCNTFIHAALTINDARFPVYDIMEYKTDKNLDGF